VYRRLSGFIGFEISLNFDPTRNPVSRVGEASSSHFIAQKSHNQIFQKSGGTSTSAETYNPKSLFSDRTPPSLFHWSLATSHQPLATNYVTYGHIKSLNVNDIFVPTCCSQCRSLQTSKICQNKKSLNVSDKPGKNLFLEALFSIIKLLPMSLRLLAVLAGCLVLNSAAADWKIANGPLLTRWAKDVSPEKVLPEYPRPQFVRSEWQNLNGLWDYAITPKDATQPSTYSGKILVPFPIESALSGVMKTVGEDNRLWYRRTFKVPGDWKNKRILIHFGAVDWDSTVTVNGREIGKHQGGYDGFTYDITDALKSSGEQELIVSVWDPTDAGPQPRGKQVRKPGGIWYTSVTGIWQTCWLEPVNPVSIDRVKLTPNIDDQSLSIEPTLRGSSAGAEIEAIALDGKRQVAKTSGHSGTPFILKIPNAKLWSPENPHLYNLQLTVRQNGKEIDRVESYFAMRKSSLTRDYKGVLRMSLNNEPYFQFGPLDQGWWPDGLYTAPTDEALRNDIEVTKKLGMNLARKHVKVEPERWYYWCDKLGLLVWQDMPSGDKSAHWRGPSGFDNEEMKRSPESAAIYERELKSIIDARYNHPCIVTWVPFNEGWGQFDTVRILNWTKEYDPSRLVDGASGGNNFPAGDILDHHQYPGPSTPKVVTDRAMALGEFGGLGLPLPGHTWQSQKNWGYRSFTNAAALTEAYLKLIKNLHPLIGDPGLSAAIYTQTTDVEVEVNGLMPYDRSMIKMDANRVAKANRKLYTPPPPPPVTKVLVPTAQTEPSQWSFTTSSPGENWFKEDFNASKWSRGNGGFGTEGTPGSHIGTRWNTPDIWIRREFDLPKKLDLESPQLLLHHDEDAEVYINGQQVAKVSGYTGNYEEFPLTGKAAKALQPGKNVISIHCHQTTGGQYIDAGLVDIRER
jgi:hypothetical protein